MINIVIWSLIAFTAFTVILTVIGVFAKTLDLNRNIYTFHELIDYPSSEGSFFKYIQPVKAPDPYVWPKIDDFEISIQLGMFGYCYSELREVAHYFPVDMAL